MNGPDRHGASALAALTRLAAELVEDGALEGEELRRLAHAPAAEESASLGRELNGPAERVSARP
ncbi:hypothetical protein NB037_00700 [Rathayibacter sp. ZW T2_19]|uniref:Uncharacterized protein n=1 Tax=Rathayibacter rubneri TaxID=2950106 RepID=A0A9X2DVG3_9MICO|nr:hypothetical protein [Rathayibacter rubneri]MCM6760926.1 hypothetical protein [Rathayibacter rubneri]